MFDDADIVNCNSRVAFATKNEENDENVRNFTSFLKDFIFGGYYGIEGPLGYTLRLKNYDIS